ncbi:uncharacterized protein BJ171DRAFT_504600 [Polychytrium aggregatum]|uniref:uncharacterized protein n=1 Tax=Polychytrium aggregatum TaxID=110093 RepID=UPI0022FDE7B0|nr:uncharacterized protein BJ171DRAFT_504600 [Polychytrium aggregatum]KAI9204543.1 hypothetical protein BJ171DRAFT_504600 [Polychytrium aggregatum]
MASPMDIDRSLDEIIKSKKKSRVAGKPPVKTPGKQGQGKRGGKPSPGSPAAQRKSPKTGLARVKSSPGFKRTAPVQGKAISKALQRTPQKPQANTRSKDRKDIARDQVAATLVNNFTITIANDRRPKSPVKPAVNRDVNGLGSLSTRASAKSKRPLNPPSNPSPKHDQPEIPPIALDKSISLSSRFAQISAHAARYRGSDLSS